MLNIRYQINDAWGGWSPEYFFKLTVFNLPPFFIKETVKDRIVNFNESIDYKLPSFQDPEGMQVYVSVLCNPSCNDFIQVKS